MPAIARDQDRKPPYASAPGAARRWTDALPAALAALRWWWTTGRHYHPERHYMRG